MDQIKIENLEVFAKHGVFPEENVLGQKFLISACLHTDTRRAGQTDDLKESIHYGEVCHFMDRYMREHTFQLIERAAEMLAQELLLTIPHLEKLELEIKKPWAPVGLSVEYVSVKIARQWHRAYIALGSNLGERKQYLDAGVKALDEAGGCSVVRVSSWLVTPPYGMTEQPDFLNGCLELKTLLEPEELLEALHRIEKEAGRERILRWGPRTLDLDIIFYDDLVWESENLCIPHVDMHRRDFVLRPLCEIAPYKRHPITGITVKEMLEQISEAACG